LRFVWSPHVRYDRSLTSPMTAAHAAAGSLLSAPCAARHACSRRAGSVSSMARGEPDIYRQDRTVVEHGSPALQT
jgi:hypothetical protein